VHGLWERRKRLRKICAFSELLKDKESEDEDSKQEQREKDGVDRPHHALDQDEQLGHGSQ